MKIHDFSHWDGKVLAPSNLAHVVLRTQDVQRMTKFYATFLGARVVYENDFISFLTYDDEHHRIAIAQLPNTSSKLETSCGLEHIAFSYPTLVELLTSYKQRERAGYKPYWSVNHGPTTSFYYKDPDGNKLEIQVDNFDSNEAADAFMTSSHFRENPIGTDFDPEDYIQRLNDGESEEILKKRVEIGPRMDIPS